MMIISRFLSKLCLNAIVASDDDETIFSFLETARQIEKVCVGIQIVLITTVDVLPQNKI